MVCEEVVAPSLLRRATEIESIETPTLTVCAHEGRLKQVLVNLIVNVAQAMATDDVERNRIVIASPKAQVGKAASDVSDNGEGIPETFRERIFDPFFTTEPANTVLAVCQGIITALGGRMEVDSSVGVGATFRIQRPTHRPG